MRRVRLIFFRFLKISFMEGQSVASGDVRVTRFLSRWPSYFNAIDLFSVTHPDVNPFAVLTRQTRPDALLERLADAVHRDGELSANGVS